MYKVFQGGQSVMAVPDDYKATGDEILFKHLPSEDELKKAFPSFGGALAIKKAIEERHKSFEWLAWVGCQIKSKGTPTLDGTYSLRPADLAVMTAIGMQLTLVGELPGGQSAFTLDDLEGSPHSFDRTNFTNFYGAMIDYLYAIKQGKKPPQPVEIP
jgi:hypothetical protein